MKKQYLHLSAYPCDKCASPVVAGSLSVRENEISNETEVRLLGAICLSCGHRQNKAPGPGHSRCLSPIDWETVSVIEAGHLTTAFVESAHRAEPVEWETRRSSTPAVRREAKPSERVTQGLSQRVGVKVAGRRGPNE